MTRPMRALCDGVAAAAGVGYDGAGRAAVRAKVKHAQAAAPVEQLAPLLEVARDDARRPGGANPHHVVRADHGGLAVEQEVNQPWQ